jgi:hypothetical protein
MPAAEPKVTLQVLWQSADAIRVTPFKEGSALEGTVTALSPKNPSSFAPMSIERMSPSISGCFDGIPCTTCSLSDAQIVAGYP